MIPFHRGDAACAWADRHIHDKGDACSVVVKRGGNTVRLQLIRARFWEPGKPGAWDSFVVNRIQQADEREEEA